MATIPQHPALASAQPATSLKEFSINDSSFLSAIKYDSTTLQCTVILKKGGEYTYFMVFPMVIDQWIQSPSKGEFYSKQIRGKYKASRIINKTVGSQRREHGKSSSSTNGTHAGRNRKKRH